MSVNGSTSSSTTPVVPASKAEQIKELIEGKSGPAAQPPHAEKAGADEAAKPGTGAGEKPPRPPRPGPEILDDGDDESEGEKKQQKTFREFAAEVGISVKQLMQLVASEPGESDEPVSFGQMKDHWRETRQFQTE